ncbi:f-box domain containing protein [Niveomyces insectorum RCEF 264]|uniref:F-box domain containing protein n=1 Tax=Niveomyces insectorum RCEF 264 TaxID=1081102 RepID=A0A167YQU8_9HYPO|nr:f-box domain containing protein [Niveomyces insectorum RCEF 264]
MIEGLYASQGGPVSLVRATDPKMSYGREDYGSRERNVRAPPYRAPRRAQTIHDYVYPLPPPSLTRREARTVLLHQSSANSMPQVPQVHRVSQAPQGPPSSSSSTTTTTTLATMPEGAVPRDGAYDHPEKIDEEVATKRVGMGAQLSTETMTMTTTIGSLVTVTASPSPVPSPSPAPAENSRAQRPKMGPPRRSYSVMDYEPVPPTHRPSADFGLCDLPPELHYAIFDFLEPIDSTCLGLTNKHFYAIHQRLHGVVPLSARRAGPNDMEWVWHLAGRMLQQGQHPDAATLAATTNALAMLRVRGQALCRKCGVSRCELHKHIQDWMPPGTEYCTVREKFGPAAPAGAKDFCYLSNPKDPHRCGRHRVPKSRPTTPTA